MELHYNHKTDALVITPRFDNVQTNTQFDYLFAYFRFFFVFFFRVKFNVHEL